MVVQANRTCASVSMGLVKECNSSQTECESWNGICWGKTYLPITHRWCYCLQLNHGCHDVKRRYNDSFDNRLNRLVWIRRVEGADLERFSRVLEGRRVCSVGLTENLQDGQDIVPEERARREVWLS